MKGLQDLMEKEFIERSSTVESAEQAAKEKINRELEGFDILNQTVEILETPKKKLFGGYKGEAVVKITVVYENKPQVFTKLDAAKKYIDDILLAMGISEDIEYDIKEEDNDNVVFTFKGESIGALIGHHGETLDSLQYLVSLSANRLDGDYYRITLDGGNYREKREETLKELAKKISDKVLKTGKSQMLEPMNPYERRIIHAVVSQIDGVYSKSKGEDPNRRVIIINEKPVKNNFSKGKRDGYNKNRMHPKKDNKPTIEQMMKKDYEKRKKEVNDAEIDVKLYSKIEL